MSNPALLPILVVGRNCWPSSQQFLHSKEKLVVGAEMATTAQLELFFDDGDSPSSPIGLGPPNYLVYAVCTAGAY